MRLSVLMPVLLATLTMGCGQKAPSNESDETSSSSRPKNSKKHDKPTASATVTASGTAAPQLPSIAPVRCSASGDSPTALGDFEGLPRAAAVDAARVFWVEQAIQAGPVTVRSVAKDGTGAKVIAKIEAKIPSGLAVDATQVYVNADNTLYAIARDGGVPKALATETFGQIAANGGTVYTFRFDATAKQDQLIAVAPSGSATTLMSVPRASEFPKVGSLAVDDRGGLIVVDADGAARIDPATKAVERLTFTRSGHKQSLFSVTNPPVVRGQQVAFAKAGVGPAAGGELAPHGVGQPLVLLDHAVIGIAEHYDDIGGVTPVTLVQESTTSDKTKPLARMSIFTGTLTGDDTCVYVLSSERGKKDQVQAYAVSPIP